MRCCNIAESLPESDMSKMVLCLILLLIAPHGGAAYITDKLLAGFYASPDPTSQPLRALPSGTPMEVLEEKGNFSRVRLGDNGQGWVETRFITQEKPVKMMLLELQAKYATLKRQENGNGQTKTQPDDSSTKPVPNESEQSQAGTQTPASTNSADRPLVREDAGLDQQQLREQNRMLQERMQQIRRLVSDAPAAEVEVPAETPQTWRYMLVMLGMLLSFIAGIAFKNYRIARRAGEPVHGE